MPLHTLKLYEVAVEDRDAARTSEMATVLGVQVPPRELKSTEPRGLLQSGQHNCIQHSLVSIVTVTVHIVLYSSSASETALVLGVQVPPES
jgi:hypothetical protein